MLCDPFDFLCCLQSGAKRKRLEKEDPLLKSLHKAHRCYLLRCATGQVGSIGPLSSL